MIDDSKIIQFKRDSEYFLELAEDYVGDDDLFSALNAMKYAALYAEREERDEVNLTYARLYSLLGQYSYSNDLYFKLYNNNVNKPDCIVGIARNLYQLGDDVNADYWVDQLTNVDSSFDGIGDFLEYEGLELQDANFKKHKFGYYVVKAENDGEVALEKMRNLMAGGRYAEAAGILEGVPKTDKLYHIAQNNLCLCYLVLGKLGEAFGIAKTEYLNNLTDIFSISNYIVTCNINDFKDEQEEALVRLKSVKTTGINENIKVATTLFEVGYHNDALHYIKLCVDEKPYDVNLLYLLGLCYLNVKNLNGAFNTFDKVLKIFPFSPVAKYYVRLVNDYIVKNTTEIPTFEYIPQVPAKEIDYRINYIKEKLNSSNCILRCDDDITKEYLDWLFDIYDSSLHRRVVENLLDHFSESAYDYILDLLRKNNISNSIKEQIVTTLIEIGCNIETFVVFNNRIKYLEIYLPQNYNEMGYVMKKAIGRVCYRYAYADNYLPSSIAIYATKIWKKIVSRKLDLRSIDALACCLSLEVCSDETLEESLKYYGAKKDTVNKYKAFLADN